MEKRQYQFNENQKDDDAFACLALRRVDAICE